MTRDAVGHAPGDRSRAPSAQRLDQEARLDPDRARGRAQAAGRARLEPGVVVRLAQRGRGVPRRGQPGDLAPADDPLPRRQREPARRAFGLAEAAFDAAIHDGVAGRQRLQVAHVRVRIVRQHDARIEQAIRIEQRLDLAHERIGRRTPLQFDERRHVAAGAVLGLERPVVLLDDQRAQRGHERAVALDFGGRVEVLREHEVQVARQRVAEDDRLGVPMLREQPLQVARRLREAVDGKRNVFDDHRGADRTHGAHRREHALAHVPEPRALLRVAREAHGRAGGHAHERRLHRGDLRRQCAGVAGARLDQQRRPVGAHARDAFGQARLAFDRAQRGAIGQLDRRDRRVREPRDGACRRRQGRRTGSARSPCAHARAPSGT